MKFQSVVTPDGMFACMYGPIPGSRHDAFLFSESYILNQLKELMPEPEDPEDPDNQNTTIYCLYGDPAYAESLWVKKGFNRPNEGTPEALFNKAMSSVRECVEWGFNCIVQQYMYLDFKRDMKMFKSPIAAYYIVAAFLQNIRTTYYGNITTNYFGATRLSTAEYISMVDVFYEEEED